LKEQTLTFDDGNIFVRSWVVKDPKSNIFIAHDHQGHGKSTGKKGHIDNFKRYSDDLKQVIANYSADGLPNHLLGHSLGGVIALGFMIRHPNTIDLSIISAPGLEKKTPPNPIKAAIGKLLANLAPKLTLWNEIEAEWICRSKKVVSEYQNDPLVHDRVSTKFFTSFLAEIEFVNSNINAIQTPTLMLLPGSDIIINHDVSKQVFEQIKSRKKLVEYPDSYHEILNEEDEKFEAYSEIENWIATR